MMVSEKVCRKVRNAIVITIACLEGVMAAYMLAAPREAPRLMPQDDWTALLHPRQLLQHWRDSILQLRTHFLEFMAEAVRRRTFWMLWGEYLALLVALPYFVSFILNLDSPEFVPLTASLSRIGLMWAFGDFDVVGRFMSNLCRDVLYVNSILVVAMEAIYVAFFCDSCKAPAGHREGREGARSVPAKIIKTN
ncbi:hypothetical protein CDCA_CDCA01G0410 [Cyanidium caldarium]|uniref:Uncharacterized protein n=1 Tax=Cyanidium caldarium TaxID=2771 RepID=A0AAV9IQM3_CYACA|nr:hypothetical protein CDCA_CDCA01G0410 [Cyanidium caldarium]